MEINGDLVIGWPLAGSGPFVELEGLGCLEEGLGKFRKKESMGLTQGMDVTLPKGTLSRGLRQAWMESSCLRLGMGEAKQRRWGKAFERVWMSGGNLGLLCVEERTRGL